MNLTCLEHLPDKPANEWIHESFLSLAHPATPPDAAAWRARRATVMGSLLEIVMGWFPRHSIPFRTRAVGGSGGYASELSRFSEHLFDSEPGAPVRLILLRPHGGTAEAPLLLVVKRRGDDVRFPDLDELLPLLSTFCVAVLYPRFSERPLTGSEHARIERSLALIGRSMAAQQIWDTMRALRWLRDEAGLTPASTTVYGRGSAGVVGLYASLFDGTVSRAVLRDPPPSHGGEVPLPAVLRLTDLPEVAGMMAPRELRVLGALPESFKLTRTLYGLEGADRAFGRARSLGEACRGRLAIEDPPPLP